MRYLSVLVFCLIAITARASDFTPLMGASFTGGYSNSDFGSGANIEASIFAMFIGGAIELKQLGSENIIGGSLAVGLMQFLQYHHGWTNKGISHRFKSELLYPKSKEPLNSWKRLNFNISYEKFEDHPELDNLSIGVGWVYN